mgnify:FL=1
MSMLQELWFGNVNPSEDKAITDEEQRLVELMTIHQEKLLSTLSNDDLDSFKKFIECSEEYSSLIEAQAFEIGFSLAVKILTEK